MKGYFKNTKTITKVDFATYLGVILAFIVVSVCQAQGLVNRSLGGMLVPICCYVCMSISLNLTVGILGELSLGHAGFMSVGAFSGIIAAMSLQSAVPNDLVRMIVALVVGAFFAAIVGFIVGIPVLRLRGDYLAIVTLAFGEIIKNVVNVVFLGRDSAGFHVSTKDSMSLGLEPGGQVLIKGLNHLYYVSDGRIATKGWLNVDGNWYYFEEKDYLGIYYAVAGTNETIDGKLYHFNSDGVRLCSRGEK